LSLSPAARNVLRAVAATLIADGPPDLGERVAQRIASLPRPADRAELDLLLRLLDVTAVNLLLSGISKPFTRMSPSQRERCLRSWATSAIPQRRKAFQALKRITAVTHYTTPGVARAIGYPGPLSPPPPTPKPIRPVAITADTSLSCDVLVVGSGAGGGVVAGELTLAGKDVIVLEKGGYRNEADFTHQESDALDTMYDAGGLLATRDLGLVVLQGSTLGGGTVINTRPASRLRTACATNGPGSTTCPTSAAANSRGRSTPSRRESASISITRDPQAAIKCSSVGSSAWDGITACCPATCAAARKTMNAVTAAWDAGAARSNRR